MVVTISAMLEAGSTLIVQDHNVRKPHEHM